METAIVIGAASGIGKGFVSALKDKGIFVIEGDINIVSSAQTDTKFHVNALDQSSISDFQKKVSEKIDHLDYLIITIGAIDEGNMMTYPSESLTWMIEANLLSPYRIIQSFIPLLLKSHHSRVLLSGSLAGLGHFSDSHNLGPYIIAKHALMGYFKVLHHELSQQEIQVSLLIPNKVSGNLSHNSAKMRSDTLGEAYNQKGNQPKHTVLSDPDKITPQFLEDFLSGHIYISNNKNLVIDKLEMELNYLKDNLKR